MSFRINIPNFRFKMGTQSPGGTKMENVITFFVNSFSSSGLEEVEGQRMLGAIHTAKLNAVIWLDEECCSMLCNTPKRYLRRTTLALGS